MCIRMHNTALLCVYPHLVLFYRVVVRKHRFCVLQMLLKHCFGNAIFDFTVRNQVMSAHNMFQLRRLSPPHFQRSRMDNLLLTNISMQDKPQTPCKAQISQLRLLLGDKLVVRQNAVHQTDFLNSCSCTRTREWFTRKLEGNFSF